MKTERHSKIVELISRYDIETQEELAQYLRDAGYKVTQATVSRDIRELRLSKIPSMDGRQKYAVIQKPESSLNEKYIRVFREGFMSMDMAMNILVVKTVPGMAMAVAAALDAMEFQEIVGCIAGDDVIMCAVRSVDDTIVVMQKLNRLLEG
ncbi:MAG: arginine repressor [Lachnospiraceae bacterium]|nr:arginine repressor [Lachnospiraceae bacterium]MBR4210353.1 arginine repressor [Lachnospiraceae bacterium]